MQMASTLEAGRVSDKDAKEKSNDDTPQPLVDQRYSSAGPNDNRLNAFEMICSWTQNRPSHRSIVSSLSGGSSSASASASPTISSPADYGFIKPLSASESLAESLLAIQASRTSSERDAIELGSIEADSIQEQVPSPFCLSSQETATFLAPSGTLRIVLNESETFLIFDMPEKMGDREDQGNGKFEGSSGAHGSIRRTRTDAETQTRHIPVKSRGTYLPRGERRNRASFVNNWLMHDDCATPPRGSVDDSDCRFRAATLVIERLIANNLFAEAHGLYNGLTRRDPRSLLLTFNYKLELLWRHECPASRGRPVTSFRWNRARTTLLAVAYGPRKDCPRNDGYLAIWCAKNPSCPGRSYTFDSPIADIDWSRQRPNWIALGFYDGTLRVIDVSVGLNPNSTTASARAVRHRGGITRSPHWQVQWWLGDEEFADRELIYTASQDGCVYRYRPAEPDLPCTEIMRISRIEGTVSGLPPVIFEQPGCLVNDLPINRNPGALLLSRHPTHSAVYFVGSEQGCIYRCSIDYFQQQIDTLLAHNGPIYSMEFSPFYPKVFLTAGADWCIRIWIEGLKEALITLRTARSCVRSATWSPTNSTVIASVVDNEICIWDIKSKIHRPTSITVPSEAERFVKVQFAANGNQLTAADWAGVVHVYDARDMPFPPYDQPGLLIEAIERALVTRPYLLKKFKSLARLS